jgi:hypothetical protein
MAAANQEIKGYTGAEAWLANTLRLPANFAFGTTTLINDPFDTVPTIPESLLVDFPSSVVQNVGDFVDNPSVYGAFNLVENGLQGAALFEGGVSLYRGGSSFFANQGLRRSTVISVERAQQFMMENGFTPERAADFLGAFDGPITARIVEPGESFLRYTDTANSRGSFLTTTRFTSPADAVQGLYLSPYGNNASLLQSVSAIDRSIVLEGGVANGANGVQQTLVIDRSAFQYGAGGSY